MARELSKVERAVAETLRELQGTGCYAEQDFIYLATKVELAFARNTKGFDHEAFYRIAQKGASA